MTRLALLLILPWFGDALAAPPRPELLLGVLPGGPGEVVVRGGAGGAWEPLPPSRLVRYGLTVKVPRRTQLVVVHLATGRTDYLDGPAEVMLAPPAGERRSLEAHLATTLADLVSSVFARREADHRAGVVVRAEEAPCSAKVSPTGVWLTAPGEIRWVADADGPVSLTVRAADGSLVQEGRVTCRRERTCVASLDSGPARGRSYTWRVRGVGFSRTVEGVFSLAAPDVAHRLAGHPDAGRPSLRHALRLAQAGVDGEARSVLRALYRSGGADSPDSGLVADLCQALSHPVGGRAAPSRGGE